MNYFNKPILIIVVIAIAATGYVAWLKFSKSEGKVVAAEDKPASSKTAPDTLKFDVNAPQLAFLQIKEADAFPEPLVESLNARIAYNDNYTARVFSPVAGRVVKIVAETGQIVKADSELLHISSPDFSQAAADSVKADADLVRKQEALTRAKSLLEVEGISIKDYESAVADLVQAEAEAQRAHARLKNLHANSVSPEGDFVLRSPLSGTISERQVNAGSEVRPDASDPLFVITDPQHLWVLVDLPERQLDKVRVGQPISVEVDAFPNKAFPGKVTVISEILDPTTRRVQVRCDVDNHSHQLKPEMFARVSPLADTHTKLPRVPNSALFTQGLFTFLFVEKSPGELQKRKVTLSVQDSDYTYIREGLKAGERIVTSGSLLLNSELVGND
jgi:cobalt-zinc-cadmium efflux system membrane fusion protein